MIVYEQNCSIIYNILIYIQKNIMTLKIGQGKHLNKRPKMIFGLTMWGIPRNPLVAQASTFDPTDLPEMLQKALARTGCEAAVKEEKDGESMRMVAGQGIFTYFWIFLTIFL